MTIRSCTSGSCNTGGRWISEGQQPRSRWSGAGPIRSAMMAATLAVIMAAVPAVMGGCGSGGREEPSETQQGPDDLDRLRSLPYVGGTSAEAGDSAGVVLYDRERTCPGYRLYTVPMLARAELIDERGRVLRRWQGRAHDRWQRAELLPEGDLLVIGAEGQGWRDGDPNGQPAGSDPAGGPIPDSTRYVMRWDRSGRSIWKRRLVAHHDIERWPDGRLLTLTCRNRERSDGETTVLIRDDFLTLLDETGAVLETRSMLEAVLSAPDLFPLQPVAPLELNGVPWVDLFHSNSVERMRHEHLFSRHSIYGPGKILVCFRHQDRVAIFDWKENTVVWSWGLDQISGPHDAQVLENGHILLFDNGLSRGWSRAIELDPLTNKIVWEYRGRPPESFFTVGRGSAQRLPNGNTLLAESDRGRALEVTADGRIVWEFICPYLSDRGERAALVRIIWHSRDRLRPWLEAQGLETTEGRPGDEPIAASGS